MLSETEFYDRLAEFFDVMTDWQSRLAVELPFIEAVFQRHNIQSILDAACGTGGHSLAFAQRGYHVTGADISPSMIARSQANAERTGLSIPFHVARFQDLSATLKTRFDAVVCLGNSFVHLLDEQEALASLVSMRACLRAGGVLILHNLNYDKRWREKPRWFAVNAGVLQNRETLVWRFADYGTERVTFNIALFTRSDRGAWSVDVQSTLQRPYQKAGIENLLQCAGFRAIEFYGNLQGTQFDATQSPDLVVVAVA